MSGVVIVGDRDGFLPSTAAGNYVRLVARGLESVGRPAGLWPAPGGRSLRSFLLGLWRHVRRERPGVVVYYGHSVPTMVAVRCAARWIGATYVIHVVEWPPAHPHPTRRSTLSAWLFGAVVFRLADGAIVISRFLEDRARDADDAMPVHRLPVLVDASEVRVDVPSTTASGHVVYCGDLNGYLDDALACVAALGAAGDSGRRLILVGRASPATRAIIDAAVTRAGLDGRVVVRSEVVPYDELLDLYRTADALLAPLPDDDRSKARFPSKLADYLLSAAPVVANDVGEVATLLRDGVSAYLGAPGPDGLADALRRSFADPDRVAVGRRGRAVALDALDHAAQGARLAVFLDAVPRRALLTTRRR